MTSSYAAILSLRTVGGLEVVVVDEADSEIWIHPDLWAEIDHPEPQTWRPGSPQLAGDMLTFGVDGQGLGIVRYRVTSDRTPEGSRVAVRVDQHGEAVGG
jgi:hypothetical protein